VTRAAGRQTAPTPAGIIARLKAAVTARYKLTAVPGRPEELRLPNSDRGVSIQYGTYQIRVRLMDGRKWIAAFDLQLSTPEPEIRRRVFDVLDTWLDDLQPRVMQALAEGVRRFESSGGQW